MLDYLNRQLPFSKILMMGDYHGLEEYGRLLMRSGEKGNGDLASASGRYLGRSLMCGFTK